MLTAQLHEAKSLWCEQAGGKTSLRIDQRPTPLRWTSSPVDKTETKDGEQLVTSLWIDVSALP